MQWSTYNTLFRSQRLGCFLYNALSNTLLELDEAHYQALEELRQYEEQSLGFDHRFLALLRQKNVLVQDGDEDRLLMARQYRRNMLAFDSAHLDLTICPTLSCNFRCPYCFQGTQASRSVMSHEIVDRLVQFIDSFKQAKNLSISWYGGEPTMAFNVIQDITRRVKGLDIEFQNAGLITNGYLLGAEKIDQLNDLNIRTIQITLDGTKHIHDGRRMLSSGRATYEKIIANIDLLMASSYRGSCNVRVNLDRNNVSDFFALRNYLLNRFKGKNLSVYAGHVDTPASHSYEKSCNLCATEWKDFTIEQYHQFNGTGEGVYPRGTSFNVCSANSHNSFVVGPEGDLYKCWEDVGKREMVVGSIFEDDPVTNPGLVALYSLATDPYADSMCRACPTLPICGGGCVNRRLRAKYYREEGLDFCSLYKDNLITYLTEYYEAFRTKELCEDMLSPGRTTKRWQGYRIVYSPGDNARDRDQTGSNRESGTPSALA